MLERPVPLLQKGTKNAVEMGRTFCTILADINFRQTLLEAHTEDEFKRLVLIHTQELAIDQSEAKQGNDRTPSTLGPEDAEDYYVRTRASICNV